MYVFSLIGQSAQGFSLRHIVGILARIQIFSESTGVNHQYIDLICIIYNKNVLNTQCT